MHALIIHSPLVGPSTVAALAASLEARGWTTTVPDLRSAVASPRLFGQRAVAAGDIADVVIAHSGAGAFLPAVAAATNAAAVFVDAVVPTTAPLDRPSAQLLQLLDTLPTVDGLLPPWHQWWRADVMAELLPDVALRQRIIAEIPQVPRSFYDDAVAVPSQWWMHPAAYLQLSAAYADDRTRAEGWDWPTRQLAGGHLDLCVLPELIANHVVDLVAELDRRAC